MKEATKIIILTGIFFVLGCVVLYLSITNSDFNFYKAELTAEGNKITERLYFSPDRDYHTLYRNFQSRASTINTNIKNSIVIEDVSCQQGQAYFKEYSKCTLFPGKMGQPCPAYTEDNEYGCTFGDSLGFKKDKEYWVQSTYELKPENLFNINGQNYIKFVAYSENRHKFLKPSSLKVSPGIIKESFYFPSEQVIFYVPYFGSTEGINIEILPNFEFDTITPEVVFIIILSFLPTILIFFGWFLFGREKAHYDLPEELSFYPNERKAWEVAAYFNPPFNEIDQTFFSTMLISFYHKKIISIQMREKDVWIKINQPGKLLDEVEKDFLAFLKGLHRHAPEKHKDGEYFFLKKTLQSFGVSQYVQSQSLSMQKEVKKNGKQYLDTKGKTFVATLVILVFIFGQMFLHLLVGLGIGFLFLFVLYFAFIVTLIFTNSGSALFVKFKEDYYKEYQHWQAFKKYLSHSFSIKHSDHRATAIWGKILVYATALGASKRVLKELRQANIIDERHFVVYSGIYHTSPSFARSSGASRGRGGGGFGGAGGGGIGGGGGGGR
jgi:uncharacterized membrane protein